MVSPASEPVGPADTHTNRPSRSLALALALALAVMAGAIGCGKSAPGSGGADGGAAGGGQERGGGEGPAASEGAKGPRGVALSEGPVRTPAADAEATARWLEKVRDIRLEYHCKLKYGGRRLFDPDARQVKAKWDAVRATVTDEVRRTVDPSALRYFTVRAAFETLVQNKEKDLNERVMWWAVRHTVEDRVGDDAKRVYDLLPDDAAVKQDLGTVVTALVKGGLEIRKAAEVVGLADREMRATLRKHYPSRAAALLATVDAVYDPLAVGRYEKAWLEKTRPDLLRRLQVEGRREAAAAKAALAQFDADRFGKDVETFGGRFAAVYRQHVNWVARYEEAGLGFLAVPHYRAVARAFPAALREAMRAKAASLSPAADPGLYAYTLQLSTFALGPGAGTAPARFVVHPEDGAVLPLLAKALGPKVGYLGEMVPGEATVALAVSGDGSKLVSIGKRLVEAIDLKTGRPGEPVVLSATGPVLQSVGVSWGGDVAYVADQRRRLRRFDLARGQEDAGFGPVVLSHNEPALAVSPDGKLVAASGSNNVQVYDAATGQARGKFLARNLVQALAFDRGSKVLLVGGQDRAVSGYDALSGERLWGREFGAPHGQYVLSLARTSDGYLAVGGSDHFAVWKGAEERPVLDLPMPGGRYCRSAGLTADRKAAVNEYGVYDLATKKALVEYAFGVGKLACAVHPDGKRVVFYARGKLRVVPVIVGPEDKW